MKVVDFKKKPMEYTVTGDAFCYQCKHEWVAVVPHKTVRIQCPECHTYKGLFKFPACVPKDALLRQCECGNELFYLTPEGHLCANCGEYQFYD